MGHITTAIEYCSPIGPGTDRLNVLVFLAVRIVFRIYFHEVVMGAITEGPIVGVLAVTEQHFLGLLLCNITNRLE
jgi:hypothetical protein